MKIKALSLCLVLALLTVACAAPAEQVAYEHPTGLRITMPEGFEIMEAEGFEGGYSNANLVVSMIMSEELYESMANVGLDPNMSLEEYGELVLASYGMNGTVNTSEHGTPYIRYDQIIEGIPVTYYGYLYQNDVAFWNVTFMCAKEDTEKLEPQFAQWASTVQLPTEAVTEPYTP